MASIWWVLVAFFAGGLAGAILVALMNINAREEEPLQTLETVDESQLRLLA